MHPFNKLILPCILLLIFLVACHKDEMTPTPVSSGQIEIDITSGVPSPQWELAPSEVAELEQALDNLSPEEFASFFDGLGYRGFVITLDSPPRFIRVQNGYVLVQQGGIEKTYVDPENQLEKWLLSISKPHLEPQLYSLLEENIGE